MDDIWHDFERAAVENKLGAAVVGSQATVKLGLEKLVRDTAADEVIVVCDTYDPADRLRSYELVAEVARDVAVAA
jgi:alkanesulfonate monooxygenase SsuD/methylene tetrahydromethanopterin reductase-like flavin-dependent oxidoreductase (luciferase family)